MSTVACNSHRFCGSEGSVSRRLHCDRGPSWSFDQCCPAEADEEENNQNEASDALDPKLLPELQGRRHEPETRNP